MTDVPDVVLDHQGDVGGHGEGDLGGQAARLGEHVQVPSGEGQGHGLLHLNTDGLLLLVNKDRELLSDCNIREGKTQE